MILRGNIFFCFNHDRCPLLGYSDILLQIFALFSSSCFFRLNVVKYMRGRDVCGSYSICFFYFRHHISLTIFICLNFVVLYDTIDLFYPIFSPGGCKFVSLASVYPILHSCYNLFVFPLICCNSRRWLQCQIK